MKRTRWPEVALRLPVMAVALPAGILAGRGLHAPWPALAALGLALAAVLMLKGRKRLIGLFALTFALGAATGWAAFHPTVPEAGSHEITGIVIDDISTGSRGQYRTRLGSVTIDGQAAPSDAYWSFDADELPAGLAPGTAVRMTARIYLPSGAENPGGFDFRAWLLARGIRYGVYGMSQLEVKSPDSFSLRGSLAAFRQRLSDRLCLTMGEEAGGYASAMLLGMRSLIDEETREGYSRLGVAHLLTVSGFHVGVLAWLLARLFKRLPVWLRLMLTGFILALYALLTGGNAPVIRASVLYVLYQYGMVRGRQRLGLWLLCASWVLMLLACPAQLVDAGFLLSYGAMLGLVVVTPRLQALRSPQSRAGKALWQNACAAAGAQLGVLLPQLWAFHELPLLALPANILILSLASGLLTCCWAALALVWVPVLGSWVGAVVAVPLNLMTRAAAWLASTDGLVLWTKQAGWLTFLGWTLAMVALGARRKWRKGLKPAALALGAVLMAASLIPWPHTGSMYYQLSVGNADAAVIWDKDDVTVIDTGSDGLALTEWLHQNRLSVDRLIITHLHSDHAGGIRALLDGHIPVKTLCLAEGAELAMIDEGMPELVAQLAETDTEIIRLARGDKFTLPSGTATVLWPERGRVRAGQDANAFSLVMLLRLHGTSILTTGDLDGRYEAYAAVPADVLKAAHHGSAASSGEAFLKVVSPQTVIVSSGDVERVALMREKLPDTPVYATAEQGAVIMTLTDEGYQVTTQLMPNHQ